MTFSLEDWDQLESEWFEEERQKTVRVRVRGYLLAVGERSRLAFDHLDKCVDALLLARKNAEHALERLREELDDAETLSRVIARGDSEEYERISRALEEIGL